MNNFCKNILFIIPQNLIFVYYKYENLLIVKYKEKYCYIKFPTNCYLLVFKTKVFLKIGVNYSFDVTQSYAILIKKFIYITLTKNYKKLNIMGIGFKVIKLTGFLIQVLVFKFGFSHSIYIQVKKNISIFCVELYKLFIASNFIDDILNLIFLIKLLKSTNIYNGKGVFFYNEKVKLKVVKSI